MYSLIFPSCSSNHFNHGSVVASVLGCCPRNCDRVMGLILHQGEIVKIKVELLACCFANLMVIGSISDGDGIERLAWFQPKSGNRENVLGR